jgi:hypothetical protein
MAVNMGKKGFIFIAAATGVSASSAVVGIDNWTLDLTADAVETTAFGATETALASRTFEPGLKSGTGSISGHYDDASVQQDWLMEIMSDTTVENVEMELYLNASQLFTIVACVTGVSLGGTVDGKTTFSMNYTLDGGTTLT